MASAAGIQWQTSPGDMAQRVERYKKSLIQAVYALAQRWATALADDARANAPWTDRTGHARRSLAGRMVRLATAAVIILSHGAEYGIYLERRWGGRYATIMPTIQRNQAAVMADLAALVR